MTLPTQPEAVDVAARILIVDDDMTNVALLSAVLDSAGYRLSTASNGHEALAAVAGDPPDLVLLDAMMPGLDGFEVCRRLKASPEWSVIPIVMVSGLEAGEDRAQAHDCGADEFLTKPVAFDVLETRVREHLERRTQKESAKP